MMDITKALDWRYAVNEFSEQKLNQDQVSVLLDATRKSASSYGLQPYKLLLVESPSLRERLVPHSFGQQKVLHSSHLVVIAAQSSIGDATVDKYVSQYLKVREVQYSDIAGYAEHMKEALGKKTLQQKREWAHQQAYLALGTLLAAAAELRIDSCPMTGFDATAYDEILGLKGLGLETTAIVALGFRSENDTSASLPKVRFDYEDIVKVL